MEKDNINPKHYQQGKIETIDYISEMGLEILKGFCLGCVIKYISRAGKKENNPELQDFKKAKWYLDTLIKKIEEKETEGNNV